MQIVKAPTNHQKYIENKFDNVICWQMGKTS